VALGVLKMVADRVQQLKRELFMFSCETSAGNRAPIAPELLGKDGVNESGDDDHIVARGAKLPFH